MQSFLKLRQPPSLKTGFKLINERARAKIAQLPELLH